MDLTILSKSELFQKCQELGIENYKSKNKKELVKLILNKKEPTENILKEDLKYISEDNRIKIINGDCMSELNKLEDNSIDCVITDPPYFIDKLDHKWSSSEINNTIKNSHITHLPKGMKFDKSQVILNISHHCFLYEFRLQ